MCKLSIPLLFQVSTWEQVATFMYHGHTVSVTCRVIRPGTERPVVVVGSGHLTFLLAALHQQKNKKVCVCNQPDH